MTEMNTPVNNKQDFSLIKMNLHTSYLLDDNVTNNSASSSYGDLFDSQHTQADIVFDLETECTKLNMTARLSLLYINFI